MYLNRCFQTGETPIAGPLIGEELGAGGFNNQNEQEHGGDQYQQPGPSAPTPQAPYYESSPPPKPTSAKPRSSPQVDNYYAQETTAPSSTGNIAEFNK